jgi:hypothetical protein
MNRRGFLQTCLALAAAPSIVRAENIMRIWTPPQGILVPFNLADGESHIVRVVCQWAFGGRTTKFYVDGCEVPGIDGVSVGTSSRYQLGMNDGISPYISLPEAPSGENRDFQTTIRILSHNRLSIQNVQYEDRARRMLDAGFWSHQ